jgi:hypothetical protein
MLVLPCVVNLLHLAESNCLGYSEGYGNENAMRKKQHIEMERTQGDTGHGRWWPDTPPG